MGFCIYNNVAVAAAHALSSGGLARVAIVDFDVHHGNGTEDIFARDPRVLFVSTFQHPLYPFSGLQPTGPNILNIPLEAGAGTLRIQEVFETLILPALLRFAPEMVFFSAGFDGHRNDPLAGLGFVEADYCWITERVLEVTASSAKCRVVSTLEGGYDLDSLGRSAAAHVGALCGV
jgi:acetoin utilization deacetylase AcuC-like enzyme